MHGRGFARLPDLRRSALTLPADRVLPADLAAQVAAALREDIGSGDVTAALIDAAQRLDARVITREDCVVCGTAWVDETFRQLDPAVQLNWSVRDGDAARPGSTLLSLHGLARPILTGERTALNFLQLLSGTATVTRQYANAIAGTGCQVLDTRKTLPGLRTAQKYAVLCGGGGNHRIGLFDQVLLKENHIAAAGSIAAAVQRARTLSPGLNVEVETENLTQFGEALSAGADLIMLDEFSPEDMRHAVEINRAATRPVKIEVSGGVTLAMLRAIAAIGVDYVSIGSLTKHVHAIDLSMRFA